MNCFLIRHVCARVHVQVYAHQIAFNVIPHVDTFMADGYTKEELKMVRTSLCDCTRV